MQWVNALPAERWAGLKRGLEYPAIVQDNVVKARFKSLMFNPETRDSLLLATEGLWAPRHYQGLIQILHPDHRAVLESFTDYRADECANLLGAIGSGAIMGSPIASARLLKLLADPEARAAVVATTAGLLADGHYQALEWTLRREDFRTIIASLVGFLPEARGTGFFSTVGSGAVTGDTIAASRFAELLSDPSARLGLLAAMRGMSTPEHHWGLAQALERDDHRMLIDDLGRLERADRAKLLRAAGSLQFTGRPVALSRLFEMMRDPGTGRTLLAIADALPEDSQVRGLALIMDRADYTSVLSTLAGEKIDVRVGVLGVAGSAALNNSPVASSRFFEMLCDPETSPRLLTIASGLRSPILHQGLAQILQIDHYRSVLDVMADKEFVDGHSSRLRVLEAVHYPAAAPNAEGVQALVAKGLNSVGDAGALTCARLLEALVGMPQFDARNVLVGLGRLPDPRTRLEVAFAMGVASETRNLTSRAHADPWPLPSETAETQRSPATLQVRAMRLLLDSVDTPGKALTAALTSGDSPERIAALAREVIDLSDKFSADGYLMHTILEKASEPPVVDADGNDPLPLLLTRGLTSRRPEAIRGPSPRQGPVVS